MVEFRRNYSNCKFIHIVHRLFHKLSRTRGSVERTVLQSLGEMLGLDDAAVCQIGDRAGNAQYAVMRTGGQPEPLEMRPQTYETHPSVSGQCSASCGGGMAALQTSAPCRAYCRCAGGEHAGADVGRVFLTGLTCVRQARRIRPAARRPAGRCGRAADRTDGADTAARAALVQVQRFRAVPAARDRGSSRQ